MPDIDKFVILAAPHTSAWDYPIMMGIALHSSRLPRVTMKKELFKGPVGWVLRCIGAIPIDRTRSHNLITQLITILEHTDRMIIAFAPEGTRKKTDHWKTGFYYTALGANVPIVCGYIDYERKRGGTGLVLFPTGNITADFEKIRDFYSKHGIGKYPERFSDIRLNKEEVS